MAIVPEPDWESILYALLQGKGIAMIIGATDSGKSTLAKYLIEGSISRNISACLIDADVGQSSLGLPGTICSRLFSSQENLQNYIYQKMSYAGTINPAKNIFQIIAIVKRMSTECGKHAELSLIDTSGLIDGEIGERLKIGKFTALDPAHVIALQRNTELEHILDQLSGAIIHRVTISKNIQPRSLATRTRYRRMKYHDYFRTGDMNDFIIYSNETKFFYKGKQFPLPHGSLKRNTVIGLNNNEDTLALGILEDSSNDFLTFSSPIDSLRNINRVVFGEITHERDN
jgi:polynucleotide 5'-hydroxyl-kinase GRC3/NOL9